MKVIIRCIYGKHKDLPLKQTTYTGCEMCRYKQQLAVYNVVYFKAMMIVY